MLSISLQTPEVWTLVCLLLENLLYFLFYWEKKMRWERQNNEITAVNGPLNVDWGCEYTCVCVHLHVCVCVFSPLIFPITVNGISCISQKPGNLLWHFSCIPTAINHQVLLTDPLKYFSICPPMKRLPGPQARFLPVSRRTLCRPLKYSSQLAIRLWLGSFN